jgi:hypothetical protein
MRFDRERQAENMVDAVTSVSALFAFDFLVISVAGRSLRTVRAPDK